MALSRDEFFKRRRPLPKVKVPVPELGEDAEVWVTKFTSRMRNRFEEIATGGKVGGSVNLKNVSAKVVALSCVDDDGKALFTEADEERIGEFDADAVQRIVDAVFKLNGLGANPVEEAAGK
jgi:hypothetical protein